MGTLRIHVDEAARAQAYPAPWWADDPRDFLNQVLLGQPGVESTSTETEDGRLLTEPTGYLLYNDSRITWREQWLLEGLVAPAGHTSTPWRTPQTRSVALSSSIRPTSTGRPTGDSST